MTASRASKPFTEEVPVLLAERGLSLRALAASVDTSPSHLSRVLRAKGYKTPSLRLVRAVTAALDLPVGYFSEERELAVIERIKADPSLRDELFERITDAT